MILQAEVRAITINVFLLFTCILVYVVKKVIEVIRLNFQEVNDLACRRLAYFLLFLGFVIVFYNISIKIECECVYLNKTEDMK